MKKLLLMLVVVLTTTAAVQAQNKHLFDKLKMNEYSTSLGWGRFNPIGGDVQIEQHAGFYRICIYDPGKSLPTVFLNVKYSCKDGTNYKYSASYVSMDGGKTDLSNQITTYVKTETKMSDLAKGYTGVIGIIFSTAAGTSGMGYSLRNY